jgi:hypothetical protein
MAQPASLFRTKHEIAGSHSAADKANSEFQIEPIVLNKDSTEDEILLPAERNGFTDAELTSTSSRGRVEFEMMKSLRGRYLRSCSFG